jgi:anti-sigma factor RsiW
MMAYTAGALEPSTQIELERHIDLCERCRSMAAEQKAVWDALDAWRPASISADFNERLYQRIYAEEKVAWWRRPLRVDWSWMFRPAMPVAAACAAIMIAFLVRGPVPAHHSPVPVEQKQISIEQVERALDDMDMLKQISLSAPAQAHASERI